jgi:CheY-like chemotaxis protein
VDDDAVLVRALGDGLRSLGHRVSAQTDPREALALFRREPDGFDAVVTDESMPGLSGEELARELLAIRPDLPIVLCTGAGERLGRGAWRALGIRECLLKPARLGEIAAAVRRALDAGRA